MDNSERQTEVAGGPSELSVLLVEECKQNNRCVVRVKTAMWSDKRGLHAKKSLTFLRRQCEGFNVLEEDCDVSGAEEILPKILNLGECKDGVYEVVTCNESRDWETGYIDDYDYRLVSANDQGNGRL